MKYFKELDIPNYEQCDRELKNYFNFLYPEKSKVKNFFNFPDKEQFILHCPTVLNSFKQLGLNFKSIFMIGVVENTSRNIHIDGSIHPCRLQWPVLNEESVDTVWYEADKKNQIKQLLPNGVFYISYRIQDCKEIARKNITKPTIIRVEEPHAVNRTTDNPEKFPRVAFSFAFEETLENFL